jgi:hypothetical protein
MRYGMIQTGTCLGLLAYLLSSAYGAHAQPLSQLSDFELRSMHGDSSRLPTFQQGPFTLSISEVGIESLITGPGRDRPRQKFRFGGVVNWDPELDEEFGIAGRAVITRAEDMGGRPFDDVFLTQDLASPFLTSWYLPPPRSDDRNRGEQRFGVLTKDLATLPAGIGVVEGYVPAWNITSREAHDIVLSESMPLTELAPGVRVRVEMGFDGLGRDFRDLSRVHVEMDPMVVVGGLAFPYVLEPDRWDYLSPGGEPDPGALRRDTRPAPSDKSLLPESVRAVDWCFVPAEGAKWVPGTAVRLHVVTGAEAAPIHFRLADVDLLKEVEVEADGRVPRRRAERGLLSLEFRQIRREPYPLGSDWKPGSAAMTLRAELVFNHPTRVIGLGAKPIIVFAETERGEDFSGTRFGGHFRSPTAADEVIWITAAGSTSSAAEPGWAITFDDELDMHTLRTLRGEMRIWRPTQTAEYDLPVTLMTAPMQLTERLKAQVFSVEEGEKGGRLGVRLYRRVRTGEGGIQLPSVLRTDIYGALGADLQAYQAMGTEVVVGEVDGWLWEETEYSYGTRDGRTAGLLRVRVIEDAAYEPLPFEILDLPVRRD